MAEIGSHIDTNVQISEAIAAARGGQKDVARRILEEITEQNPNHEQGFLWLAALAETPSTAVRYLERVLEINPSNMQALNALAAHRLKQNGKGTQANATPGQERPRNSSGYVQPNAGHPPKEPFHDRDAMPTLRDVRHQPGFANPVPPPPPSMSHSQLPHRGIRVDEPRMHQGQNYPGAKTGRPAWRCPLCDTDNIGGLNKCRRCGALQDIDDVWALAENRGVDEGLVTKGAEKWLQRLMGGPNFEAHANAARAYLNLNRSAEAVVHLEKACEMRATERTLRTVLETLRARKLVLAVDDSATVRRLVAVTLERKGYRVVTAEDGLQALAKLADHTPDMVLLDITMPKMDGYEVCKVIKRNQGLKHVPVLMLSGKDGIFDKIKGRMAGATDYMSKPFDIAMLLHAMERHLGEEAVEKA